MIRLSARFTVVLHQKRFQTGGGHDTLCKALTRHFSLYQGDAISPQPYGRGQENRILRVQNVIHSVIVICEHDTTHTLSLFEPKNNLSAVGKVDFD